MRTILRPFLLCCVLAACSSSSSSEPGSSPAPTSAPPGSSGEPGAPAPPASKPPTVPTACGATMDWKPFAFDGTPIRVAEGEDLQAAIDAAPDGSTIELAAGKFVAKASPYEDPTCGNCQPDDPKKPAATTGFVIRGKSLLLRGAGKDKTSLVTGAGYGVLVEDACEVRVEALAITGGKRDPDGAAADAGLVARRSRVALVDAAITKNTQLMPNNGYPGIAGILCREGSDVLVLRSELVKNSWDGVAVYRGGHARVIASRISDGNGAAVGVTWDGRAKVVASDLSKYWKGVGSFQDAKVEVYASTIHEQKGWGLWAADRGELVAVNNSVVYNDQLGVFLATATTKGRFVNNLVAFNGENATGAYKPDTFGRAGVRGFSPASSPFAIAQNVLFGNQATDWVAPDAATTIASDQWGATNRSIDPMLVSRTDPRPMPGSPLLNAGDPDVKNPDGTRSHVGATGGPYAGATEP